MSNQLDNFFKDKLQNRSYEYDESAWEEARLLIEKEEQKDRRKKWLYILSSFFLLSLVGLTAFYMGKSSAVLKKNATPQNKNIAVAQSETKDNTTKTIESALAGSSLQRPAKQNINKKAIVNNELENIKISKSTSKSTNQSRASIKKADQIGKINSDSQTQSTNNTFQKASGVASNTITSNIPNTTYYNPKRIASTTPKQITKVEENQIKAESQVSTIPSLALQSLANNEQAANIKDLLPGMLTTNDGIPSAPISNRWSFGLRAGTAIVPSSFTDFDGGAFAQYQVNRNVSISFQPHYTYQKTNQSEISENEILEFGFGLRTSAFTLSTESIRSLHAPIMVSYAFGNSYFDLLDDVNKRYLRNRISVGVSYVYLDGVSGSIRVKESASDVSALESGWLPSDSFNRHNAEVLVGYERFLTKRLSLGLMARYRFRDQFSTIFIQQNTSANQTDAFYLGLQAYYKLF